MLLVKKGLLLKIPKYNLKLRMYTSFFRVTAPHLRYSIRLLILLANLLATSWIKHLLTFSLFYTSYPASYCAFNLKTRSVKWLILICLKRKEKYSSVHHFTLSKSKKEKKKKENIGFNPCHLHELNLWWERKILMLLLNIVFILKTWRN